jgi:hypothetical protein
MRCRQAAGVCGAYAPRNAPGSATIRPPTPTRRLALQTTRPMSQVLINKYLTELANLRKVGGSLTLWTTRRSRR